MENFESLSMRLVQLLSRCIVPIYQKGDGSIAAHIGTGFLVRGKTGIFLVSAGHVLRNMRVNKIFLYVSEKMILNISGRSIFPPADRHDKLDVGIVKLNCSLTYFGNEAKNPAPIELLVGNVLPRDRKSYLLIRVPETKSRFQRRSASAVAQYYSLFTESSPYDTYGQLGVSPYSHLVLAYNWKRCYWSDGSNTNFPNIEGMSGSPIFLFEDEREVFRSTNNRIVGVLIEYHPRKQCLVATDIRYPLEIITRLDR